MSRSIRWDDDAWDDFQDFRKNDPKIAKRIAALLAAILTDPFRGIGKPEPLKYNLAGYWSRRITDEHRLVYKVTDDAILIAQVKYHY